ncbi:hypothetical protein VCRA2113O321_160008 [Vibrio crassostreae]|nr:hypothetical protein VCRA2113O321_160008 [Vibrio crassostreae]
MKKLDAKKRRAWQKLHLAVHVDTPETMSAEVSFVVP